MPVRWLVTHDRRANHMRWLRLLYADPKMLQSPFENDDLGSVGLVDPMSSLAIVQDCSMRRLVVDDSPL